MGVHCGNWNGNRTFSHSIPKPSQTQALCTKRCKGSRWGIPGKTNSHPQACRPLPGCWAEASNLETFPENSWKHLKLSEIWKMAFLWKYDVLIVFPDKNGIILGVYHGVPHSQTDQISAFNDQKKHWSWKFKGGPPKKKVTPPTITSINPEKGANWAP